MLNETKNENSTTSEQTTAKRTPKAGKEPERAPRVVRLTALDKIPCRQSPAGNIHRSVGTSDVDDGALTLEDRGIMYRVGGKLILVPWGAVRFVEFAE